MTQPPSRQPRRPAPTTTPKTQALAPREKIAQLIATPATTELEIVERIHELAASGLVNMVTPVTSVSKIPAWTQISFARVDLNPIPDDGDVYIDRRFCKGNEAALTKNAILRLMQAAGVQKLRSYQADTMGDPYFVQWTVFLQWRDFSGRWLPKECSKTIDLRDGAPATQKPEWVCKVHRDRDCRKCQAGGGRWEKSGKNQLLEDSALAQARLHIHAQAETKALLRGVREFLVLKQKYRADELKKPFIVPTLVPDLPMDDPQVKAAVLERELGVRGELYGKPDRGPGITAAILSHDDASRGVTRAPIEELEPPKAETIAPIVQVDAAVTPAPGDQRVIEVEAGPVGPEPPPIEGTTSASSTSSEEAKPEAAPMPPAIEELEKPTERPPGACSCPCGCAEVPAVGWQKKSRAALGTVRCKSGCYPDLSFDQERHAELANLEIPKAPNATPAQVEAWNKRRRAAAKGGAR